MLQVTKGEKQMELVFSDIPENPDDAPSAKKTDVSTIGVDELIKDIKELIENGENHKAQLSSYLQEVEEKIQLQNQNSLENVDKEEVKRLIEKHPYFKNPNSYHIRMITIMKYLKKKKVDISIPDFDLLVDEIIQSIDGVTKVADGKYKKRSK